MGRNGLCVKRLSTARLFYVPNPDFMPEHLQAEVWNNTLGGGNEDLAYKLANAGYKTVLTCVTNLYFDMAHYKSFDEPGYYWGAFADIDKPFSFIPYDYFKNSKVDKNGLPLDGSIFIGKQRLTDYGKTNIIGLQSAVWGENIKSPERLEYMMLPRPDYLDLLNAPGAKIPDWATEKNAAKKRLVVPGCLGKFPECYWEKRAAPLKLLQRRQATITVYQNPALFCRTANTLANEQFPGLNPSVTPRTARHSGREK